MDFDHVKRVGIAAAYKGGAVLRSYLGKLTKIDKKGPADLVTLADIESEKIIIKTIGSSFPNHSFLAEESGPAENNKECKWIIDPLDGTTNFAHQIGMFAVSIAFEFRNEIVVGIVYNPETEELFTAVKGQGALLNQTKIKTSAISEISESLLVTGFPYNIREDIDTIISRLVNCMKASQGVRRLGSAALDLCYVACGRFEAFWEQNLNPWDTAAGVLIAKEAGVLVTDFEGNTYSIYGNELLASNSKIHEKIMALLELK
jgi:myo-inositol-1(or 4)-monophosphatase